MKRIWLTVLIILLIVPLMAADQYQPIRHPNGWYWPTISGSTNTEPGAGYNGWLEPYNVLVNGVRIPAIHVGKDFDGNQKEPVFAIANGEVIEQNPYLTAYGPNGGEGGALIAQFKTSDGSMFRALYGHIDNPHELGPIHAGEILGYINSYNPSHLHFGIHLGNEAPPDGKDYRGFIRKDEYTGDTYGWVNPIVFLDSNEAPEGVVGEWSLNYDWDCNGSPEQTILNLYSDGTLDIPEFSLQGKWEQSGDTIRMQWDVDQSAEGNDGRHIYEGKIDTSNMEGAISVSNGKTGCWSAYKRYTDPGVMA